MAQKSRKTPQQRKKGTPPKKRSSVPINKKGAPLPSSVSSKSKSKKKKDKEWKDLGHSLNPHFDPRMRRIGSPLNQGKHMKRGWIQEKKGGFNRVNFLFNPSMAQARHAVDPDMTLNKYTKVDNDRMEPRYYGTTGDVSFQLLYDRTYEMFSKPKNDRYKGLANHLGVYADVAAWYVFLGMLDEMPEQWNQTLINRQPLYQASYLFLGPKHVYYGWLNSIQVNYSHWTQDMIPVRCSIDLGFSLLPHGKKKPKRMGEPIPTPPGGWRDDWNVTYYGQVPE